MRSWGFFLLLLLVGTISLLAISSSGVAVLPGSALEYKAMIKPHNEDLAPQISRKLKVTSYPILTVRNKGNSGKIDLEDYPRFDPAPNTRATIKAGPIEHGTPLMPYIPQPTPPPSHPKHGSPDPAPSTRAANKAEPVDRGTPLMPYIPPPIPPSHPKHGSP